MKKWIFEIDLIDKNIDLIFFQKSMQIVKKCILIKNH